MTRLTRRQALSAVAGGMSLPWAGAAAAQDGLVPVEAFFAKGQLMGAALAPSGRQVAMTVAAPNGVGMAGGLVMWS
ncbi:MAG: hypothetical protein ACOVOG_15515, partial [Rubrivivax sp.]